MVVCGGSTGKEIGSDWREVETSDGRKAARLATISSISLRIAPSAATSCADLSSSVRIFDVNQKSQQSIFELTAA